MELQFENVGFRGLGETGIPKEIPVVARTERTNNNNTQPRVWLFIRNLNPGLINGRRVF